MIEQLKEAIGTADAIAGVLDNTKWLIWSFEHRGWWKPNACGYTEHVSEAGAYTFKEAKDIVVNANRQGVPEETMCPDFRKK